MIRHIVLLKPRGSHLAGMPAIDAALSRMLQDHFPAVKNYRFGTNLAPADRQHGFTHGFSMDFDSLEALTEYGDAAPHQPVKAMVRAACELTVAFDFEVADG